MPEAQHRRRRLIPARIVELRAFATASNVERSANRPGVRTRSDSDSPQPRSSSTPDRVEKPFGQNVIATGESHSIRELLDVAFARVDLDWKKFVEFDPRYVRPAEVDHLLGDASKARREEVMRC